MYFQRRNEEEEEEEEGEEILISLHQISVLPKRGKNESLVKKLFISSFEHNRKM